jgi:predicted ATPase
MKLKSVRVRNFKSVDDSTPFSLLPLTCLVGKNEAGKSALLEALYKLNPVIDGDSKFDPPIEFYPRRRWSTYKDRHDEAPDPILDTEWELDDADKSAVEEALCGISIAGTKFTLSKGYDNVRRYGLSALAIDEKGVLGAYLADSGLHTEEVAPLKGLTGVAGAIAALKAKPEPSERETAFLTELQQQFADKGATQRVINLLDGRLPKFIYFSDYDRLPGQVSLTALLHKKKTTPAALSRQEHIFLALLDLAGTDAQEIQQTGKFEELKAELEAIQNTISDEIFEFWSQNSNLRVEFTFDAARTADPAPFNEGWIFRTRIENTRHRASVPFERRSTGFVWFFSFLVWFSQLRKHYGDNLVVLLDEPGLTLHGKAQGDLLRYVSTRLVPHSQVLYSTHSPFMVDPDNLLGVRTVEDVMDGNQVLGTKVGDQVLSTDADTIFPLQAALGYDISQTLFVGQHPLLVEGPSDLLYLKWFSHQLKLRKRTSLDVRWTVSPSGGIDKMGAFVTLFGGKKLDVAVLSDYHQGDKKKIETLRQSSILKTGRVLTAEAYADATEADIEDVLGREMYFAIVNGTYALKGNRVIPKTAPKDAPARVVVEAKNHIDLLADLRPFDHFDPAAFLVATYPDVETADKIPGLAGALDRFERLFTDLNAFLKA